MTKPDGLSITKEEIDAILAPIELGPASGVWITAREAVQYVETSCSVDFSEARAAICRRALISIPVTCVSWSVGEDPHDFIDRYDYFRENKRVSDHFRQTVSRKAFDELLHFFEAIGDLESKQGDYEIEHASWATGDFKVHLDRDFSIIHLGVIGLQFDRVALEQSFSAQTESNSGATVSATRKSGGRPQSAAWPQWIAELSLYIHENGYPLGEGAQGQEAIINAVADRLAERGLPCPSRSTVQAAVQALLDRFRDP